MTIKIMNLYVFCNLCTRGTLVLRSACYTYDIIIQNAKFDDNNLK